VDLLVKYILIIFGAFGLWSAYRAQDEPRSETTDPERAVDRMGRRMARLGSWAILLAGTLQVTSGYQSPFDFLAAPLDPAVLTAWGLMLSTAVYWWIWAVFIASPDELHLVKPRPLRSLSPSAFKLTATVGGGLAVSLVLILWRSSSGLAKGPSGEMLPLNAIELISAVIGATFLFGGLLAETFREEALANLADPTMDRKAAGGLLKARREAFTPQGWQAMRRARLFGFLVLVAWLTIGIVSLTRA
jgi:hypothetical protein